MNSKRLLIISSLALISITACSGNTIFSSSSNSSMESISSKNEESSYPSSNSTFNYDAVGILRAPAKPVNFYEGISSTGKTEKYNAYIQKVRDFSNNLTAKFDNYFEQDNVKDNYSVSPISIYSCLAMASSITKDKTKEELLSFLNSSEEDISSYYKYLFSDLEKEYVNYGDPEGEYAYKSHLSNSLWVDKSFSVKDSALDVLSNDMYCYSIEQDFKNNIKQSNKNVSDFIYNETNKFLSVDLNLKPETVFMLLNCYYLKSAWENILNGQLQLTDETYDFTKGDGTTTKTKLMVNGYEELKINKQNDYSSIYVKGQGGAKLYLILPSKDKTIKQVFTKETLDDVLNTSYYYRDEASKKEYYTSVRFPSFKAETSVELKPFLMENGVKSLFNVPALDFSPLTDNNDQIMISNVKHITKLNVDRKGIEGAAVTAMMAETTSVPNHEYEKIYETFDVDKAFGYVITYGSVPAFAGIVNTPEVL